MSKSNFLFFIFYYTLNMEQHTHPIYQNYFADEDGNIYHKDRPDSPIVQTTLNSGYRDVHIPMSMSRKHKHYLVHRFTYECYHGLVPRNMDVHHIDGNPTNNKLSNLQSISHKINVQLRHGYKGVKFEHLDELPIDAIAITKIKKNEFDNLFYVPSTDSFYVLTHDKYVKKIVDKDGRIHVMKTDGKIAHHKVSVIMKILELNHQDDKSDSQHHP